MNFLKRKKKIKLIARVLIAISIFSAVAGYNFIFTEPMRANAATTSTITINKLTYAYSGTTASVTSSTATGSIVIPPTITVNGTTYKVTSIGSWAFNNSYGAQVTSIAIPNTVTSIGSYAFNGTHITSLVIPSSVISIGDNCFYNCNYLVSVTIPNSVTSIGNRAFTNCSSLKSVTIPSSVKSISPMAFYQCTALTSVTISSGVTSIGQTAFYNCTSLTSVKIPSSVTSIGEDTFLGCNGLKSVYFEEKNSNLIYSTIGAGAFNGCPNVTTLGFGSIIYTLDNLKLTATTSSVTTDKIVQFGNKFYTVVCK